MPAPTPRPTERCQEVAFTAREVQADYGNNKPRCVFAADLDADGDMDALVAGHNSGSSSNNVLDWFELDSEQDDTFHDHELDADLDDDAEFDAVYAVDVDADGDVDVVAASSTPGAVYWYKHNWFAGNGTHFRRRQITAAAPAARSVYAVDLDDDGDVDLLSASCDDDTVAWYEQDASAFTKRDIETVAACASDTAPAVYAADVDGDGRIDVVSASSASTGDKVAWYRSVCKNKLDDTTIRTAVTAWFTNQAAAEVTYGHISAWDTSEVTNMEELFCAWSGCSYYNPGASSFNEDISAWDTSGVTTTRGMFRSASAFNQDLGEWAVRQGHGHERDVLQSQFLQPGHRRLGGIGHVEDPGRHVQGRRGLRPGPRLVHRQPPRFEPLRRHRVRFRSGLLRASPSCGL